MAIRKVILEMRSPGAGAAFAAGGPAVQEATAVLGATGLKIDPTFAPMPMPPHVKSPKEAAAVFALEAAGQLQTGRTFLVRGEIDDAAIPAVAAISAVNANVIGMYADVWLSTCPVCPGSPPVGDDSTVEQLLGVPALQSKGMDGSGVFVAIVDTGINLATLNARGKTPTFDAARSFTTLNGTPGAFPVDHGTMCAFDVCIAAPRCTLLDIAVVGTIPFQTLLSDAVRAYSHLLTLLQSQMRPGGGMSLVVSNSWGRFPVHPDFPPGNPSNYSDNPNHPFNRIVDTLESFGADILFAAGNCGPECPDDRCNNVTDEGIYGANSHPKVLCIGGVDVNGGAAGYSTRGPGRLDSEKPDVCAYTHFRGSGVYAADGGTSAATPVAAGLVAALRTKKPYNPHDPSATPQALRSLVAKTATDKGTAGFDYTYGWGVVNGPALATKFGAPTTWTTFFTAALTAGETHGWFSEGWAAGLAVDWRVAPKGQAQPVPQLTIVWRALPQSDGTVMYTFDVTNGTGARVEFDLQYGH
jgi:hypothetical protein